jgi:hypothetical protein
MFSTILKLIKPRYAVTMLLLFGVLQGAVSIKKVPGLRSLFGKEPVVAEEASAQASGREESLATRLIASYHPAKRLLVWILCYTLVCLALVPGIQMVLEGESNFMNGMMITGFTLFGGLLAFVLMAFRWSWGRGFLLLLALGLSCTIFVGLAGQLEKMRLDS